MITTETAPPRVGTDATYDYVVVGGGSAGAVVAARLAEDPDCRVLLLESGPVDDNSSIRDPAGQLKILFSEVDYAYKTVPQRALGNRQLDLNAGRVLGGSSSINGMIYVRGDRSDFDGWAYLGCTGWDYESVLPYFKKSEDFAGGADDYRAVGGPLHVAVNQNMHPLCETAVQACVEAGVPLNEDYNGASMLGANRIQHTVKDGMRWSTAQAFLRSPTPNLEIRTDATAHRLVVDGGRCRGVRYEQGGRLATAHATSEVVVSAGAFGSPKLLLLSGIGDSEELSRVGIDPVHQLPGVGRNLHDHPLLMLTFAAKKPVPPQISSFMHAQCFVKSDEGRVGPDLQPTFMHIPFYQTGVAGPSDAWTIGAGLTRPSSRGSVTLRSADPRESPLIDINYLATEDDISRVEQCFELVRHIVSQSAYRPWLKAELAPGIDVTSKSAVRDFIRSTVGTYYHSAGSCKMGPGADAVVDHTLRVHGLDGLRVADASIMPEVTSGNTNAPSIMIGEKAADMIKTRNGTRGSDRTVLGVGEG